MSYIRSQEKMGLWADILDERKYTNPAEFCGGVSSVICLHFFQEKWWVLTVQKIKNGAPTINSFLTGGRSEYYRDNQNNIGEETPIETGCRELMEEGRLFLYPDELCFSHSVEKTHVSPPFLHSFIMAIYDESIAFHSPQSYEVTSPAWMLLSDIVSKKQSVEVYSTETYEPLGRRTQLDLYHREGVCKALINLEHISNVSSPAFYEAFCSKIIESGAANALSVITEDIKWEPQ